MTSRESKGFQQENMLQYFTVQIQVSGLKALKALKAGPYKLDWYLQQYCCFGPAERQLIIYKQHFNDFFDDI